MKPRGMIYVVGYADEKLVTGWNVGACDDYPGLDADSVELGGWTFDQLVSIYQYSLWHGHDAARRLANQHRTGVLPLP